MNNALEFLNLETCVMREEAAARVRILHSFDHNFVHCFYDYYLGD